MDLKSYQAGRTDGLQLALRLVKEGGQEALEKEIKSAISTASIQQ